MGCLIGGSVFMLYQVFNINGAKGKVLASSLWPRKACKGSARFPICKTLYVCVCGPEYGQALC